MSHLIYDQSLLEAIRSEVLPTVIRGEINHEHLSKNCPLLGSPYADVLRAILGSPMVRDILETTTTAGKTLRKGDRILVGNINITSTSKLLLTICAPYVGIILSASPEH